MLAVAFYVFALIVPLAQLMIAFVTWLVPLDFSTQKRACIVGEVIGAWSGLDVTVLTMIVAFMQVGQFAKFIVGDKCDALAPILHLPEMNVLLNGDDVCLDVHATYFSATWWLLGVAFVGLTACQYVANALRGAIDKTLKDSGG